MGIFLILFDAKPRYVKLRSLTSSKKQMDLPKMYTSRNRNLKTSYRKLLCTIIASEMMGVLEKNFIRTFFGETRFPYRERGMVSNWKNDLHIFKKAFKKIS